MQQERIIEQLEKMVASQAPRTRVDTDAAVAAAEAEPGRSGPRVGSDPATESGAPR